MWRILKNGFKFGVSDLRWPLGHLQLYTKTHFGCKYLLQLCTKLKPIYNVFFWNNTKISVQHQFWVSIAKILKYCNVVLYFIIIDVHMHDYNMKKTFLYYDVQQVLDKFFTEIFLWVGSNECFHNSICLIFWVFNFSYFIYLLSYL